MSLKFKKLTRSNLRKLNVKDTIIEHGISYDRLSNGDGRFAVNVMVDGQRIHRILGKDSEGVTRQSAEDFIEQVRTDARNGRINLPKDRKTILRFKQAILPLLLQPDDTLKHLFALRTVQRGLFLCRTSFRILRWVRMRSSRSLESSRRA